MPGEGGEKGFCVMELEVALSTAPFMCVWRALNTSGALLLQKLKGVFLYSIPSHEPASEESTEKSDKDGDECNLEVTCSTENVAL